MKPLVSVVVITYNSERYILEGLKSIEGQTYDNIELIISDDCSTDNTVEICKEWINNNKNRFMRVELIEAIKNTGVAGNLNRGIKASNGEWIKTLSGDDKLLPESIEMYIDYTLSHEDASIVFGKLKLYGPDNDYVNQCNKYFENNYYPKIRLGQHKQYLEDLKGLFIPGPGLFYRKKLWQLVGGFDERYQFCEEIPFTHKILKLGYQIQYINKELYIYQVRKESLGRQDQYKTSTLTRPQKDTIRYFFDYKRKEMIKNKLILQAWDTSIIYWYAQAVEQRNTILRIIYKSLRILSPLFYKRLLIKL